jgi:hypothetical protein
MSQNNRYKIKRAIREGFRYQVERHPSPQDLEILMSEYGELQARKGLAEADWRLLPEHIARGEVAISRTVSAGGCSVSSHMFIVRGDRARLAHSITLISTAKTSAARNQAARAHRMHHWEDIRFFRSCGLAFYDLGGWSGDKSQQSLRSVDEFKESFGGQVVNTYHAIIPITLKGRIVARILGLQP